MSTPHLIWSEASDGHMGVSASGNRKKYFTKVGIDPKTIVDAVPSHGNKIKVISKRDAGKYFEGVDGLITKEKGITLALTCADCMPVAFFNPLSNSIGLIHCGFRGLENGIIGKTIKVMKNKLRIKKEELIVYIGPHICKKHYRMDLSAATKKQLIAVGIKPRNIKIDPDCTFEDRNLFSYRRGDSKCRNLYLLGMVKK